MEPNREFAELVGVQWHEQVSTKEDGYGCSCGFLTYFGGMYGEHIRDNSNPDYAADPRLVLREMDRIGKLEHFLAKLNAFSLDEDDDLINKAVPVDYFLDITGLLRDKAIEWLRNKP